MSSVERPIVMFIIYNIISQNIGGNNEKIIANKTGMDMEL